MIIERLQSNIEVKKEIISNKELISRIKNSSNFLIEAFKNGKKVLFCGNGGSAADAQHLAAELSGRFYFDRPPLPAEACHTNSSFITAISNDYGYRYSFSRYVETMGKEGDILIGLSSSGNAENVIEAFKVAKELKMVCIGFTGKNGGKLADFSDLLINVPSKDTPRIQEAHITIGHILCEIVEESIFGHLKQIN